MLHAQINSMKQGHFIHSGFKISTELIILGLDRAPFLLFAFLTTADHINFATCRCYDSSCLYLCRIHSGLAHEELKTLKSCVDDTSERVLISR